MGGRVVVVVVSCGSDMVDGGMLLEVMLVCDDR